MAGIGIASVVVEYQIEYEQITQRWELRNQRSIVQPSVENIQGIICEAHLTAARICVCLACAETSGHTARGLQSTNHAAVGDPMVPK
jgi:hypothetical protein